LVIWEENEDKFKPTEDPIGTIYPRIEVVIPFSVTPVKHIPQEEDR